MLRFSLLFALSIFLYNNGFAQKKNAKVIYTDTIAVIQDKVQQAAIEKSKKITPINNVNLQMDLYKKDILFCGFDEENHWQLFIKEDSAFIFVLNTDTLVFEYTKYNQAQDASIIRYYSKALLGKQKRDTTKMNITITITNERYRNENTAADYPFKLNVSIGDHADKTSTYYSGGGFYIGNPLIHDIWVLDSIHKKPVQKELFPNGLPRLEFHLDGGKFYGFGGCNELNGTYYFVQHQIHINPPVTTLKLCTDMTEERNFVQLLNNKRYAYSIQNMRLKFMHKDGTVLVFKKVD